MEFKKGDYSLLICISRGENMRKTGIILSDEHFGVIDADRLLDEHEKIVISYINTLDSLDFIIITGDFFDHILQLNERHAKNACKFMNELFQIAKKYNSKIRIVYGTESHECNQYTIFKEIDDYHSDVDVRLIRHVCEEELFPEMYVLYLPEEYIYNKSEYYKEFFTNNKKYHYIFGHGIIQELMSDASYHITKSTKSSNRAKVPIFNSKELIENCCGEVYFGHYHIHSSIQDKIFYVGSFTRWCFGEEEPKGFYHIEYDDGKYHHTFIENTMAESFNTISYGYDSKIFNDIDTMNQELDKIEKFVKNGIMNNIRIILNIPDDYENPEGLIKMMGERFKNHPSVKTKITNGYVSKSHKINKEYLNESVKKYGFIFDKNMPIAEQAHLFIKEKYEKEIDSKRIEWHLTTTDVLAEECE